MNFPILIPPTINLKTEYYDIVNDFLSRGESVKPWGLHYGHKETLEEVLEEVKRYEIGENLPADYVKTTTYWLVNERNRILGAVNIRHYLNQSLLDEGGNIGYAVRPTERRKGYATEMLRLALEECRKLGMTRALVTCNTENIGSAKVIKNNGGIYENSFTEESGQVVDRYWIVL